MTSDTVGHGKMSSYLSNWISKVERVAKHNFPDDARRLKLVGGVLLDVAILPDGSVLDVVMRRSSGYPVLDDAARRIVYLAAPFAAFPPSAKQDFDILHIVRTWRFSENGKFKIR